ncbi:MAG: methyltransferase domain-containing protein [Oceanibaculum sp.]
MALAEHRPEPRQGDLSDWQRNQFGTLPIVTRRCPACGHDNSDLRPHRYSLGIWTAKQCYRCRFLYLDKAPDYSAMKSQISWENSTKLETEWRAKTRSIQTKLSKSTRWRLHLFPRRTIPMLVTRYAKPGNVLDLGCGDGGQIGGLPADYVPYGIEISQALGEVADQRFREQGGHAVIAPCLHGLDAFPAEYFSAASLRSYLEHELHPFDVLAKLHRVMQSGGVAVVKVPNYACWNRIVMGRRWSGFRHPDHLNYFTPSSLKQMARRAGFATKFLPFGRLPTADNMWALLIRS